MVDFSIFDGDKLRRMSEITMMARESQVGEFLARTLQVMQEQNPIDTYVGGADKSEPVECVNIPTVEDSKATTIKQLVADYNKLLEALREAGVIA